MSDKNLKYIHCEKYIFNYEVDEIINNFPFSCFSKVKRTVLKKYLHKYFQKVNDKKLYLPRNSYNISSIKLISLINDFILFDLIKV